MSRISIRNFCAWVVRGCVHTRCCRARVHRTTSLLNVVDKHISRTHVRMSRRFWTLITWPDFTPSNLSTAAYVTFVSTSVFKLSQRTDETRVMRIRRSCRLIPKFKQKCEGNCMRRLGVSTRENVRATNTWDERRPSPPIPFGEWESTCDSTGLLSPSADVSGWYHYFSLFCRSTRSPNPPHDCPPLFTPSMGYPPPYRPSRLPRLHRHYQRISAQPFHPLFVSPNLLYHLSLLSHAFPSCRYLACRCAFIYTKLSQWGNKRWVGYLLY